MLGKDGSTNDTSTLNFYYAGSGSSSNRFEVGFWGADSLLNVLANGNVGIGETNPSHKLDVAGDIKLNSDLYFEGATADSNETKLTATDPTADRTITLPDATGTVALLDQFGDIGITRGIKSTNDLLIARNSLFNLDEAALLQNTVNTQIAHETGVIIKAGGTIEIQPKDGAGGSYRVEVESAGLHPYSLTGTEAPATETCSTKHYRQTPRLLSFEHYLRRR